MGRRSIVALFSICVHAIVLLFLMTADLGRPISEWPSPRAAIAFVDDTPRPVHVEDVQLSSQPAIARRADAGRGPETLTPIELAPVDVPNTIGTEKQCEECALGGLPGPPAPERIDSGPIALGIPPAVPTPPPAQPPPIRLHSGIRAPERVVNVAPVYPAIAKSAHVEGVVIIEATIDEHGNVVRTDVLRSISLLDAAAVDAVRQWKFRPTLLNGVAVPIVMTVTVNFTLQ